MEKRTLIGYFLAFVSIFVWSTTYIFTKKLLEIFTPYDILFFRFIIAYIFLWIINPVVDFKFRFSEEIIYFLLGLTGVNLYFMFENLALSYTQASNVGLIVSSIPMFTAVLAHFMQKDEHFHKELTIGFVIAISGIFLVIFNGSYVLKLNPIGDILALLCSGLFALYSNLAKKTDSSKNKILIIRRSFFYGIITMLPVIVTKGLSINKLMNMGTFQIFSIGFLGLFASAICFITWNKAIEIIGAIRTTTFIYLVPLITMISSLIFLKERVNLIMISGGLMILGGVYFSERRNYKVKNECVEEV